MYVYLCNVVDDQNIWGGLCLFPKEQINEFHYQLPFILQKEEEIEGDRGSLECKQP